MPLPSLPEGRPLCRMLGLTLLADGIRSVDGHDD
jgi:hypothetical protein